MNDTGGQNKFPPRDVWALPLRWVEEPGHLDGARGRAPLSGGAR